MEVSTESRATTEDHSIDSIGYLECINQDCTNFGLTKIPQDKTFSWDLGELADGVSNVKIMANCPGCQSTRLVRPLEEVAPDIDNDKEVAIWIEKFITQKETDQSSNSALQQAKDIVKLRPEGASKQQIQKSLVDFTSHNYPT